jgi:aspartate kinase
MALIVHKYGGTSMGSTERIKNVAARVAKWHDAGHRIVVVPSAMSGETNRLIGLAKEIMSQPDPRELDMIASTGEQVSVGLLAMALLARGKDAVSYTGWQVGIKTDSAFTKARIQSIDDSRVRADLDAGKIVIITGFQGVDDEGNISTLGRGGSDTSAVAIAAALKADECLIYTDVDGVYTTDPNICPSARKIPKISYEEMLELASLGAKVLQIRSVEIAMKYGVKVHVRSSFNDAPGTWVTGEEKSLEDVVVAGVAYDKNEARVHLVAVEDKPGVVAEIFGALADKNVSVDMIIQNVSKESTAHADVTFTLAKTDLARAKPFIEEVAKRVGCKEARYDEEIVKVSIVGLGMRSHAGIAAKMFRLLAGEGINIQAISTSEIKVSCLIHQKYTELAVRCLHDGFGLNKDREAK